MSETKTTVEMRVMFDVFSGYYILDVTEDADRLQDLLAKLGAGKLVKVTVEGAE